MTRLTVALLAIAAAAGPALGQARTTGGSADSTTRAAIVALEKETWNAWKNRDTAFFRTTLAENAIQNGREGVQTREQIIRAIAGSDCDIRSFSFDESSFRLSMVDENTALLTYKAMQDYTCGGKAGPSPVWSTAMYVRRDGRWQNVFYQETTAEP